MSSIVTYSLGTLDTQCEVGGLQFGVVSPEEARRLSVVECDESSLYVKGVPMPRSVLDHRMGTVDRRVTCGTCGQGVQDCPGHWGRIELPLPVLHVAFVETIRKLLNCVCYSCSRIRIDADQLPPRWRTTT